MLDTFAAGVRKFVIVAAEETRGGVVSSLFCDVLAYLVAECANELRRKSMNYVHVGGDICVD